MGRLRPGAEGGEVEALEQAEDLPDGERARAGRPHAADPPGAVLDADRRALLDLVIVEVLEGHHAGVGLGAHRGDDVAGDGALVERRGAFGGDQPQGAGEVRVAQGLALGLRAAVLVEVEVAGRREAGEAERLGLGDGGGEARRDGKAASARSIAGRKSRPRAGGRGACSVSSSRRSVPGTPTERPPAIAAAELDRRAVRAEPSASAAARSPARRARSAADRPSKWSSEAAAAEARALRLDQGEHQLHRDHGVDRGAVAASTS